MTSSDGRGRPPGAGRDPARSEDVLETGSHGVRRPGRGVVLAVVAVLVLLVSCAVVLLGGPSGSPDPGDGAPIPAPGERRPQAGDPQGAVDVGRQDLVRIDQAGRLSATPGARIVDRIRNPLGVRPPVYSWAVSLRLAGEETWWLLESAPASRTVSTTPDSAGSRTLEAWVASEVVSRSAASDDSPRVSHLVRFVGDTSRVAPRSGVELLGQRADLDPAGALAAPEDTTVVAEVRWRERRWYVLARRTPRGLTAYLPFVATGRGPGLQGFLDVARAESAG